MNPVLILENLQQRFRDGKIPVLWIALGAVGVLVLGFVTCNMLGSDAEDLLDVQSLSEAQIRQIATELLLDEDLQMRERASAKLAAAGRKASPVLKDVCLTTDKPALCEASLGILLTTDVDAAMEVLTKLVDSPDAEVRRSAVDAIGSSKHPKSGELLAKAIRDTDSSVRLMAVKGFGARNDPQSISILIKALDDESPKVRTHAVRFLRSLTGRDYSNQARRRQ